MSAIAGVIDVYEPDTYTATNFASHLIFGI